MAMLQRRYFRGYTYTMRVLALNRNIRSGDQLELLLVSAVSSLLAIRFYLHLSNYPQLGGSSFHIAHMLWGGLLMITAVFMALSFIGPRVQRIVAITAGIGFGAFIDELGKFITRDNNYFFEPTIGLIYAIFIVLYLLARFMGGNRPYTSKEYQLNALVQLEEAVLEDMDPTEKQRLIDLLDKADQRSPITHGLITLIGEVTTVPSSERSWLNRQANRAHQFYIRVSRDRHATPVLRWFFIIEAVAFVLGVTFVILGTVDNAFDPVSGNPRYEFILTIAELASSIVAAIMVIIGATRLPTSRAIAYEWFRRAILVNLFLTEFFIFSRIQFGALPSFAFNILLFILIRYAIQNERHVASDIAAA
jgi:hypothetical protein